MYVRLYFHVYMHHIEFAIVAVCKILQISTGVGVILYGLIMLWLVFIQPTDSLILNLSASTAFHVHVDTFFMAPLFLSL